MYWDNDRRPDWASLLFFRSLHLNESINQEERMIETKKIKEKAILVGIVNNGQDEREVDEFSDELFFRQKRQERSRLKDLPRSLMVPTVIHLWVPVKIQEIASLCKRTASTWQSSTMSLLSQPDQKYRRSAWLQDSLQDEPDTRYLCQPCPSLSHARKQVELPSTNTFFLRLTGMWTHLERQRGGIGLRGPGEN